MQTIMLKLSGELIQSDSHMFDHHKILALTEKIIDLYQRFRLAIVMGAGNIWRFKTMTQLHLPRETSDALGMLGTIYNANILAQYIRDQGIPTTVYTPQHFTTIPLSNDFCAHTARHRIAQGEIVFCAGGTGNPYCTTDLAAVLRALELGCDMVVKVTTVDGVYDSDPRINPHARRYDYISHTDVLHQKLMVMDQSAFGMASENNLPIAVCNSEAMMHVGTDRRQGTIVRS
ncbi:MAG: hypothetical protein NZL83_02130 [Candidatus Absconditabacterales bacterium]|nr:hypothetical protein [Candidatus Absconditabacterales bacterium]